MACLTDQTGEMELTSPKQKGFDNRPLWIRAPCLQLRVVAGLFSEEDLTSVCIETSFAKLSKLIMIFTKSKLFEYSSKFCKIRKHTVLQFFSRKDQFRSNSTSSLSLAQKWAIYYSLYL